MCMDERSLSSYNVPLNVPYFLSAGMHDSACPIAMLEQILLQYGGVDTFVLCSFVGRIRFPVWGSGQLQC